MSAPLPVAGLRRLPGGLQRRRRRARLLFRLLDRLLQLVQRGVALRAGGLERRRQRGIRELLHQPLHAGRWRRLLLDDLPVLARELVELAERRERREILQGEELQELAGGPVQDGAPRLLLLPEDLDELPLQERLHDGAAVDRADLLDLRPRDRLPVRDDRERLERGAGQPLRLDPEEPAGEVRVEGRRPELPAAGHLVQDDAADPLAVVARELIERLGQPLLVDPGRAPELLDAERPLGDEEERLDDRADPLGREAARRRLQLVERLLLLVGDVDLGGLDLVELGIPLGLLRLLQRAELLLGDARRRALRRGPRLPLLLAHP